MSRTVRRKNVKKPDSMIKDHHFWGESGKGYWIPGPGVKEECRSKNRIKTRHFIQEVMKAEDSEDVNNTIPKYQRCGDIWNWD